MSSKSSTRRLSFEYLESRRVLSLTIGIVAMPADFAGDQLEVAEAKGGGGKGGGGNVAGPEIDLPTVVAHELGHSLGLPHSTNEYCGIKGVQPIMCPYYLGADFRLAPEDVSKIRALYPNSSEVKNSSDARWDDPSITYSFMPDGTSIDKGGKNGSELSSVMQKAFPYENWQSIFQQALNLWAKASNNALTFTAHADDGSPFNTTGASQGDTRFGDIRFGSHKFDVAGGVLAHAYFPPPNGATAAGDAHFAKEENWTNSSGLVLSPSAAPATFSGNLRSAPGRSGTFAGSTGSRSSELQFAANMLGAQVTEPAWSIGQASFRTNELHALTASTAERNVGLQGLLERPAGEQPQRAASTRLASVTAARSSESVVPNDSSRDSDLLAERDEVLLNWPASETSLAELLHLDA